MPELPEVENIKIQLTKYLVGHIIEKVEIRYAKCLQGDPLQIQGGKIEEIRRFGKVISIDLDNNYSLVIHIKLTGQLIYRGPNLKSKTLSKKVIGGLGGKHTHVIFYLDRNGKLYYNDVRKFGWIKITKTSEVEDIDFIKKLGPEPFGKAQGKPSRNAQGKPSRNAQGKPSRLTLEKFSELVKSTKRSIKTLLMDQSKIGGVGNIYANDALWLSKISPTKSACELSDQEIKRLYKAIETVLKEGLKRGGASELAFVTPDGAEGNYQDHFLAYGREGQLCPRCKKTKFKKIKVAGRGTVFCPYCQK